MIVISLVHRRGSIAVPLDFGIRQFILRPFKLQQGLTEISNCARTTHETSINIPKSIHISRRLRRAGSSRTRRSSTLARTFGHFAEKGDFLGLGRWSLGESKKPSAAQARRPTMTKV